AHRPLSMALVMERGGERFLPDDPVVRHGTENFPPDDPVVGKQEPNFPSGRTRRSATTSSLGTQMTPWRHDGCILGTRTGRCDDDGCILVPKTDPLWRTGATFFCG